MSIRLTSRRCEEIKRIVVRMYRRYHIYSIPINGFELAAKMCIKVMPYSAFPASKRKLMLKQSKDGFSVLFDTGKWHIYYNDDMPFGRINNTIMHEIGHITLDHTEDSELAEKEVNFFAKYALVPPVLLERLSDQSVENIATVFGVSLEAAYNAKRYYWKWLHFGGEAYTPYESETMKLFKTVG